MPKKKHIPSFNDFKEAALAGLLLRFMKGVH